MSNKRKKLARALSAKTGMSHHAAINVLRAKRGARTLVPPAQNANVSALSQQSPRPSLRRRGERFDEWLIRQARRADRVGDLAGDLQQDPGTPPFENDKELLRYLDSCSANSDVRECARAAWREFNTGMMERIPRIHLLRAEESVWLFGEFTWKLHCLLVSAYRKTSVAVRLAYEAWRALQAAHLAVHIRAAQEGGVHSDDLALSRKPLVDFPFSIPPSKSKPQRLPLEMHIGLGRVIKGRRLALMSARQWFGQAYPADDVVIRDLDRALEAVGELRSHLDDIVAIENPRGSGVSDTVVNNAYYGEPQDGVMELAEPGSSYRISLKPRTSSRSSPLT